MNIDDALLQITDHLGKKQAIEALSTHQPPTGAEWVTNFVAFPELSQDSFDLIRRVDARERQARRDWRAASHMVVFAQPQNPENLPSGMDGKVLGLWRLPAPRV